MYVSLIDVVYPKYSMMWLLKTLSGFSEHRVHLYIGFGMPGASLHGTIGMNIDAIKNDAEAKPEYINFLFNCMV